MPAGFMLPPGYTLRQLQEKNKNDKVSLWIGTQAEFAALGSTDINTVYLFTDDPAADVIGTLGAGPSNDGYEKVSYLDGNNYVTRAVAPGLYMVRIIDTWASAAPILVSMMFDLPSGDMVSGSVAESCTYKYDTGDGLGDAALFATYGALYSGKYTLYARNLKSYNNITRCEIWVRRIGAAYTAS